MDLLIAFGGAVKAEGDGRFRAPLITFGGEDATDLSGDFFTPSCDFWRDFPSEAPLLYHHGLDAKLGLMKIGRNNRAKLSRDDAAVWMQGQLDMADEYQKRIYALIESGKMGTSSGSAPHMVKKQRSGNAWEILSWPIAEASLTPTPAEPRNRVAAVKSEGEYRSLFTPVEGDPMSGVGMEITSSALSRMFDRVLYGCYQAMQQEGAEEAGMHSLLDSFNQNAKQFISAVCAMDDAQDRQEAMTAKASPETIRETEQFLRDVWKCSRKEAKGLAPTILPLLLRDVGAEATETVPDPLKADRDNLRRLLVRESLAFETLLGATI